MVLSRHSVQITETETEFLLSIHASQKERAKAISGYQWDMDRRCWVYPRTARSYDALIDEFGNDLIGDLTITRPGKPVQAKPKDLKTENQDLKAEMSEIRKTLELISGKTSSSRIDEAHALQSALAAKENELTEIRHRAQDLERQLQEQCATAQQYFEEIQRLKAENKRFQGEIEQQLSQGAKADIQKWIRETIKNATDRNEKFCTIVENLRFNSTLPIELVKALEGELRKLLDCDDRNASLHDLLTQASDAGILSARGLDFAHIIRKQRNILAHEATNGQTLQVRILLCLFAAALLWAEFAE